MPNPKGLIFGPVPSRRLGLSLGVDMVPFKVCTLDCLYCQVGHTTRKSVERKSFVDLNRVMRELVLRLQQGSRPDYITLSGSGEPTLNRDLGVLIERIKRQTDIPVALITNGTLLHRAEARQDCLQADVILPSLDAVDASLFQQINRPHPELSIISHIEGLEALRDAYTGQIWLEIFLIDQLNTHSDHMAALQALMVRLRPDRIHLNTAVRPTADPQVVAVPLSTLQGIADRMGPTCEVIADFQGIKRGSSQTGQTETILALLQRRPCSAPDIAAGLGINQSQSADYLEQLVKQGKVYKDTKNGRTFYRVPDLPTP